MDINQSFIHLSHVNERDEDIKYTYDQNRHFGVLD